MAVTLLWKMVLAAQKQMPMDTEETRRYYNYKLSGSRRKLSVKFFSLASKKKKSKSNLESMYS